MQLPDRAAVALWLRRPRNRVLLGVLALLVAVRIALPYVLRPIIVAQADEALVGRIALADLDLSLIRGGVTLRGLEVYPTSCRRPGRRSTRAEAKKPLFSAGRLWTQISWIQLLLKTIDVEEFELDDFAVRVDRLKDGLVLPKPAPKHGARAAAAAPSRDGRGIRLGLRRRQPRAPQGQHHVPRLHGRRGAAALRPRDRQHRRAQARAALRPERHRAGPRRARGRARRRRQDRLRSRRRDQAGRARNAFQDHDLEPADRRRCACT